MREFNLPPNKAQASDGMERRDFLKGALGTASLAALSAGGAAWAGSESRPWVQGVCDYLEGLRRPDGGYAWPDQAQSHLTPSFAAVGCYHLLEREPPDEGELVAFLRKHHPFALKKLERDLPVFEYQQIQSLLWLDQDVGAFRDQVQKWAAPSVYPAAYEKHSYPVLQMQVMAFLCRPLVGLSLAPVAPAFTEYLLARQRPNGSFNNTPAQDGGDGHVMNTWWAIQALEAAGKPHARQEQTVEWVRKCQRPGNLFTWQPEPPFAEAVDVIYTWAAVNILRHFEAAPEEPEPCIRRLLALRNADGGFGPRLGWPSNPEATYRALDALGALNALDRLAAARTRRTRPIQRPSLPDNLKVFTAQIEAHGNGSCTEAVEIARALRIDLWGAKNAPAGWIARAQSLADQREVPVKFFVANEEYGTYVDVPGLGTYSHTSDIIAPAGVDFGASLAGKEAVSWEQFRQKRLAPLEKAGGRLIWQFGENQELTRLYLDDSLQRGGYAAISTFHFGNPDFTNSEPFLKHYWQQVPFIALQDAHGGESWWWLDQLTGFRTLFLAAEPTWAGWLTALKNKWVVAVRHDAVSGGKTWMHGGPPQVLDFVREREDEWRWWDDSSLEPPLVSVVAVTPQDQWEKARPEQGVTIRVRCRWDNTAQGLPKTPRVELLELAVDGQRVTPTLAAPPGKQGGYQDHYHYYHIAGPTLGKHTAAATVRVLATGVRAKQTIEFIV